MAGLFPGVCNTQSVDVNGIPLRNSVLTVYQGGTLTLANCFQDIGLAIPAQNPMTADFTGRLPVFYVADGVYRVRLVDEFGVEVFDLAQVASIGASSSGGGGSAVDPTTIFQTGDPIWLPINNTRTGWVRMNGRTIGSATSGASERANADCQPLYLYLWATFTDALCPVSGGRGVSAAADWAANKPIGLLDMRGSAPFGLDTMGNAAAGVLTQANLGADPTVAATAIGEQSHLLATSELPTVTPAGTIAVAAHAHALHVDANVQGGGGLTSSITGSTPAGNGKAISVGATDNTTATATFTGTPFGSGARHNTVPPGRVGTWFQKL